MRNITTNNYYIPSEMVKFGQKHDRAMYLPWQPHAACQYHCGCSSSSTKAATEFRQKLQSVVISPSMVKFFN